MSLSGLTKSGRENISLDVLSDVDGQRNLPFHHRGVFIKKLRHGMQHLELFYL
jgi:hypothetical protein